MAAHNFRDIDSISYGTHMIYIFIAAGIFKCAGESNLELLHTSDLIILFGIQVGMKIRV